MSIKALNWAFEVKVSDAEARLILLTLGNYANEWGICYPGYPNLLKKSMCSKTTLWRRLTEFQNDSLLAVIKRRYGQKVGGNAYLLPGHAMAMEEEFIETMGDLGIEYISYEIAWHNLHSLNVSERNEEVPNVSDGNVSIPNVSELETYILKGLDPISKGRSTHSSLRGELSLAMAERIDDTMTWLKNKKSMRHLPPQEYLLLFIDLQKYGINLDEFKLYYEWLEKQDWVSPPIGVPLLKSAQTIESYLTRDTVQVKGGKNGKPGKGSGMSSYLAELQEQSQSDHS